MKAALQFVISCSNAADSKPRYSRTEGKRISAVSSLWAFEGIARENDGLVVLRDLSRASAGGAAITLIAIVNE